MGTGVSESLLMETYCFCSGMFVGFFPGQCRMSGFVSSTPYLDLIVAVQVFFSYVTCVRGCL